MSLWAKRDAWLKSANLHTKDKSKTTFIRATSSWGHLKAAVSPLIFLGFLSKPKALGICP